MPVDEDLFSRLQDPSIEATADFCVGSFCGSWTGKRQDLPAYVVDRWVEIEVKVRSVWRGSPGPTELIYAAGLRAPELGDEFMMFFPESEDGRLMFGACQPLFTGIELKKYADLLGEPIYSYE